ncbi:hypothetical protein B6N60_00054 [Richelia sinica FACHB-800]|uniref:Uncharacterized protein n=1 Tax=Richelia sinica FACHB-800 TaxID=1357546 RepID=A0A975T3Q3_9NOST|nr:hypothetical protein B6N60_00054 [Richelia sinica FACHB-800]
MNENFGKPARTGVCLRHPGRTEASRGGFTDIINYEREFW